jgi:sodium/hydrogen antiporter
LNLESGLNDGLALPAVLAFAAALDPTVHHFVWWRFVLRDVGVGLLTGLVVAGAAFGRYGVAVAEPRGNGLIAVFVCAIVLGTARPDMRESFEHRSEELIELLKLGTFVVFGSLLTLSSVFSEGWAAVGIVAVALVVARPPSMFASLVGTGLSVRAKAFMGWFGPKGPEAEREREQATERHPGRPLERAPAVEA